MTTIIIGSTASNRATASGSATYIDMANPATVDGILNRVDLWFATNATGVKVGTFFGSAGTFTSRSYVTIGNVTAGSLQSFTGLSIQVKAGDVIGVYFATGTIEYDTSGGTNGYNAPGDLFDGASHSYTLNAADAISAQAFGQAASDFFF